MWLGTKENIYSLMNSMQSRVTVTPVPLSKSREYSTKLHAGGGISTPSIKPAKVDIGNVFTDLTVPDTP
jgi:hypothetical protein